MSLQVPLPENLRQPLVSVGYVLLKTSENLQERVKEVFDAARLFFSESLNDKIANMLPEETGYRPFGVEYSRSPEEPDQIESFTVTARHQELAAELSSPSARDLWDRMLKAFTIMETIAEALTMQLAAEISNRPVKTLRTAFHRWSRLQLNYSRPATVPSSFINEEHEDGSLITLACATGPGLEIRTNSNEFAPLPATAEEILIMPGEIAWLLSGGLIQPLYHRVRPLSRATERMALLFFGDIDPSCCEPWIKTEINSMVNIGDRVLTNVNRFGLKGFAQN